METKSFKCIPDSELSVAGLRLLSQATLVTELTGSDSAAHASAKRAITDIGLINNPAQVCKNNSCAFNEPRELKASSLFLTACVESVCY